MDFSNAATGYSVKLESNGHLPHEDTTWNMQFDHVFHIVNASAALQSMAKKHEEELQRNDGDFVKTTAPHIKGIVEEALGDRVVQVDMKVYPCAFAKKCLVSDTPQMSLGLILGKHRYKDTLERGPEANTAAAAKFCHFWGAKLSELRRFSDGSMAEGIAWKAKNEHEKRVICGQIVREALSRHAAIDKKSIIYVGNIWDSVLQFRNIKFPSHLPPSPSNEEHFIHITSLYDTLSRDLRSIPDLPLVIASIRSTSPILRWTEVFPPLPAPNKLHSSEQLFFQRIPLQLVMEGSSKWPNDRPAISRLKTAFQLKLGDHLKGLNYYVNVPDVSQIHVWKGGYCFSVEVVYLGELALSRKIRLPDGRAKLEDTPECLRLREKLELEPKLAGAIDGVRGQNDTFSTACRIAKRWTASQLLDGYVAEQVVELLMAQVYLRPQPDTVPVAPDVAFLRFLALISRHNWQKSPLIVDFKNDMTYSQIAVLKTEFTENRSKFPVMTVVSHFESASHWTQLNPSGIILKRLVLLAKVALDAALVGRMSLPSIFDPKTIFRSPANDDWDCLIHLRKGRITRSHEVLDDPLADVQTGKASRKGNRLGHVLDLSHLSEDNKPDGRVEVDLDSVGHYVSLLRQNYGQFAFFFLDLHGGCLVMVVWKTAQFKTIPLEKVDDINGRMVENVQEMRMNGKKCQMKLCPNMSAMVEDFSLFGRDLVAKVEIHPEKWKI